MKPLRMFVMSIFGLSLAGCGKPGPARDQPRLTPAVQLTDVTLHSAALHRDMPYRVITPAVLPANTRLPVLWLLHGAGGTYQDWSNDSGIAQLARHGVIVVMPDATNSYYINSASRDDQRYQDYLVTEVIPDLRRRFPAADTDRSHNAVIGISRGGFGAIVLALKHPELFSYAGLMSSAFDLAERPTRWREPAKSLALRRAFGPANSATRTANDPFQLIPAAAPSTLPYLYLTCGEQDPLLPTNKHFVALLEAHHIPYEFHTQPGSHNWNLWNAQLPALEQSVLQHFGIDTSEAPQSPAVTP